MKFIFNTDYSEEELKWLDEHNCKIMSEIKLSRTNFKENGIPRRMFKYGGAYIGEILDSEYNEFMWGVLTKWRKVWCFYDFYESLDALYEGF